MKKKIISIGCILTAFILIIFIFNHHGKDQQVKSVVRDTLYDTLKVQHPKSIRDTIIRHDTISLGKEIKVIYTTREKVTPGVPERNKDTLKAVIPISQRVYSDSTYTAYISGYDVKLDSIKFIRPTITITKTVKTIKKKHFGFGLQGGVGLTPKGVQPYIGFGLQWNLW